jgi:sialate O-acetylesterase
LKRKSVTSIVKHVLCIACVVPAFSQVQLPNLFSDHAVLQRDKPLPIWGWAKPGEIVTVSFHDQNARVTADDVGCWKVWLKPEAAGGPYQLKVAGSSTLTVEDLLVGDVWLASGQSNMEMPLKGWGPTTQVTHGLQAIDTAGALKQVRLLRIEQESTDVPQVDFKAKWSTSTPESAADFSAIAFFFGRELNQREHVPIGLIDSTWGGTPIEAWISLDGLSHDASLMPVFASRAQFAREQIHLDRIIAGEDREDAEAIKAGRPAPTHAWHAPEASWSPAAVYNGMVAPEAGYAIKGVIWYQGESNATPDRGPMYARLMTTLITDWRTEFAQGNVPFFFVQIAGWNGGELYGVVRDAQRRSLSLVNTGMATSLDVGDMTNVHPADKPTVANRLALAARAIAYGEAVEFSGPLFRQVSGENGALRVWFDHADGLHSKGPELLGFEIAGADHKFFPAIANIDGKTVVVHSDSVPHPESVRYGWRGWTSANLYNKEGLPAPTFSSESDPQH